MVYRMRIMLVIAIMSKCLFIESKARIGTSQDKPGYGRITCQRKKEIVARQHSIM